MKYETAEHILQTYDMIELLEYNELTEADVLCFLVDQEFINLPEIVPVDYDPSEE